MAVQIYNSLTKKKEEFIPINGNHVKMYTCGVTVYDQCHIGHARSLYIFGVIRQYLQFRGFKVEFVRNRCDKRPYFVFWSESQKFIIHVIVNHIPLRSSE